jgi:hypothetical protein
MEEIGTITIHVTIYQDKVMATASGNKRTSKHGGRVFKLSSLQADYAAEPWEVSLTPRISDAVEAVIEPFIKPALEQLGFNAEMIEAR